MQGGRNINMRDTTLYVAQNVCTVTTALMFKIFIRLWRLRFMDMPAGVKMIHPLFPKDQIQVPYLQVVRIFSRGWWITLHLKVREINTESHFCCMVWEVLARHRFVWSLLRRWLEGKFLQKLYFWFFEVHLDSLMFSGLMHLLKILLFLVWKVFAIILRLKLLVSLCPLSLLLCELDPCRVNGYLSLTVLMVHLKL